MNNFLKIIFLEFEYKFNNYNLDLVNAGKTESEYSSVYYNRSVSSSNVGKSKKSVKNLKNKVNFKNEKFIFNLCRLWRKHLELIQKKKTLLSLIK
jgi:hypothetical protein